MRGMSSSIELPPQTQSSQVNICSSLKNHHLKKNYHWFSPNWDSSVGTSSFQASAHIQLGRTAMITSLLKVVSIMNMHLVDIVLLQGLCFWNKITLGIGLMNQRNSFKKHVNMWKWTNNVEISFHPFSVPSIGTAQWTKQMWMNFP